MAATNSLKKRKRHRKPARSDPDSIPATKRRRKRAASSLQKANARQVRYDEGFGEGYREGVQSGIQSYPTLFEGTSIVIPTYNQQAFLAQCIDSIIANTDSPYEIIVVDNASTDGTAAYLQELGGQIRYRVLENNRGFAGAVNVGMMMAKGRTILLLNNDTLVTENWLANLLICLNSDEGIGMVGPVTNYISGEQKINVPYVDVADMPRFARENNRSDASRWQRIDRLTGFCLLFRRELFEGVGFFDEGFEIGNFEDDDYNIRVRMLGKSLVIAKDTFIHHFGSVSMKALGDRFQEVNDRNHFYFMDKWQNPYIWVHNVRQHPDLQQGPLSHSAHYFPEHIVVQAIGANYYWIENGVRRLVEGVLTFPVTRISQVDLRRWPLGEPISADEVEQRWRGLAENAESPVNGVVVLPEGESFHVEGDKIRRIISSAAMQAWNLHLKTHRAISQEMLEGKVHGLPIISLPLLRQLL
ncbi:glycosyltransferase family 2 protein [Cohnella luojiensis]|uniref:Glycosyltransferase family 2 protein n=1 Tax=Cohnella luojiensis TaxID=652876 RepID=A0A4Y8M0A1_9BACL|nr:glycosyltransferase family 2 protein [Cohnella luojiensis]TFE27862.1 glycosyltransferase family 2 protein [Cohnella luojiensis]